MNKSLNANSYTKNLFLYLILYLGIAQILDFFLPIKLFKLSIFITYIPYLITFLIFIKNFKYYDLYKLYTLYILTVVIITTIFIRSYFYNEDFFLLFVTQRYLIFIPIFFLISEKIINNKSINNNITLILYIIFFIHTINSFFYILGLPAIENVDKLADDYIEFSRFTGIMGGANVQASFISLLYSLLIFSEYKMNFSKFILLTIFAIIGIAPTVSRGSILILILIVFYFLYNYFITNIKFYKIFILSLMILSSMVIISSINNSEYYLLFESFSDRFDLNGFDTGRSDKNIYFYKTITNDWLYYILGIPIKFQYFGLTEFDSISDNSFTLILSNLGILGGLFFLCIIIIFTLTLKIYNSFKSFFYILLLLIILYNNNAVVWTAWSAYAILGLFYIRNIHSIKL